MAKERVSRRLALWQYIVLLLAAVASIFAGYQGYNKILAPQNTNTATLNVIKVGIGNVQATVSTTGTVMANNNSKLSFQVTGGTLAAIYVKVGDSVKKGDKLAQLDTKDLTLALRQSQASLASAQAKLDAMRAGSRPEAVAAAQANYDAAVTKLKIMQGGGRAEDVATAQSQLNAAVTKLNSMQAGGRSEDVATAQAQVNAAQDKLNSMLAGSTQSDLVSAQKQVDSAQAKLNQLLNPVPADVQAAQQTVAAAQSSLETAQANLEKVQAPLTPDQLIQARAAVDKAQAALVQAQAAYDKVPLAQQPSSPQAVTLQQATIDYNSALAALNQQLAGPNPGDVASAQKQVDSAKVQLQAAQAKLNQLMHPTNSDVQAAQAALASAQAALAAKQQPYTQNDIAQQKEAVNQASLALSKAKQPNTAADIEQQQQTVNQLQQAIEKAKQPYTDADLSAQEAQVAQALQALKAQQQPYLDTDIAQAVAAVDQAKVAVDQAQYNMDNATLVAPFDGQVNAISGNIGETAPAGVITLVDPTNVRIDVSVDETDIAKIALNEKVSYTFDALGIGTNQRVYTGKVIAISPNATIQSGVATYLVSLSIDNPQNVLPGMTANATIVYQEKDNTLVVPLRAVRTQRNQHYVEVLVDPASGKIEQRQVQVGVQSDQSAEILSGLKAGDEIVIPGATIAAPRIGIGGAGGLGGGGPRP